MKNIAVFINYKYKRQGGPCRFFKEDRPIC